MAGKAKIHTFGCQMNEFDSDSMRQALASLGFSETEDDSKADLVLLNTCSVRAKPAAKVRSLLGRLGRLKARKPQLLIVVAGCVAQQEGKRLATRFPHVDIVLGPDRVHRLAELVGSHISGGGAGGLPCEARRAKQGGAPRPASAVVCTDFQDGPRTVFPSPARPGAGQVTASLVVMKGCNQFCAYCVVPYTRGREVSKPPDEVLAEAAMLAAAGAREVCLLGQNVNRYGLDLSGLPTFAELLRLVHGIEGIERIRFVTSHPADCTDELLRCFRDLERLTPYFHLPIQSGSNRILQRMNRWYTREHYLDRVRLLRSLNPDVHISTDIIVGFPGESEEDHELTLDMIRQVGWGSAYSFKYSPRPGTAAAKLPDDVPAAVKQERLEKVQSLLYDSRRAGMARHVGRVESVLVEGASVRSGGRGAAPQLTGRTGTNYVVNFSGGPSVQELAGRMVPVRIIGANRHSLVGELAPREA